MALQNRVDPYGTIFRTTARGTMMGNRGGAIHNEHREIVRPYKSRQWIACLLKFKGRHRVVMTPNRYTELFFLDEAVALAAGHRPCAECRRERFNAFSRAWTEWEKRHRRAPEMDVELHRARIDSHRRKVTYIAPLDSLPNGTFIEFEGVPYLLRGSALLLWTPDRYGRKISRISASVTVLTPRPIVHCLLHGYRPQLHPSSLQ